MINLRNTSIHDVTNRRECLRRALISLILCSLAAVTQAAQSENSLTLSSAIKRTIAENPSLKAFEFRDSALKSFSKTASLSPAYELEVEAENFAGSGEFSGADSAELTVALSSVIEMGGKRDARIGVASSSRTLLEAKRQVRSLELLGEVTRRYGDVLAAQAQVSLASEASDLAKNALDIVKKRAKAGATPDAEVMRAQAAVAQATLTLSSTRQQLNYQKIALTALWGETTPHFSRVEGNLFHFGTDIDFSTLYAKVENNPAIQIFAAEQRLKDAEIRLAKTQYKSDISWSVGVRQDQENDDTALVAGFSLPLFSSKRNASSVSAAMANRNELLVQKEIALLNLHTQLFRAFHNRKQAIITTETLQGTIIPALEQALKDTQLAYKRGRYGYLEYVSARQELLNARRTLIEAAAAALMYGAEIEQLTAEPLSAAQYGNATQF